MEKTVFKSVMEFKKRYPSTIMWRVKKHCNVIQKHLNPNEKVTSDRILIGQDQILYGYTLNSVTPEMYNDLQILSGIFWGRIRIDTVKEVITFTNFQKKALTEIESIISMYMLEAKKLYPNKDKVSSVLK